MLAGGSMPFCSWPQASSKQPLSWQQAMRMNEKSIKPAAASGWFIGKCPLLKRGPQTIHVSYRLILLLRNTSAWDKTCAMISSMSQHN